MANKRKDLNTKYRNRRIMLIALGVILILTIGICLGNILGKLTYIDPDAAMEAAKNDLAVLGVSTEEPPTRALEPVPDPVVLVPEEMLEPTQWELIVVNMTTPLSTDFQVELERISGTYYVDKRIATPLVQMIAKAKADGINLEIFAAYRDTDEQEKLYNEKRTHYLDSGLSLEKATEETDKKFMAPLASEHQTGLAVDISTPAIGLDPKFEQTAAYQWLAQNAKEYGFVLRYPKDKQDITGLEYSPCHFRYVGTEVAAIIWEHGYALEEYIYIRDKKEEKVLSSTSDEGDSGTSDDSDTVDTIGDE